MMKKFFILFVLFEILFLNSNAQPPDNYYNSAIGKKGYQLKMALYNIIDDHTSVSYDQLWTSFESTDAKPSGKVWDIYSDIPNGTPDYEFTFGTDQCGNYSSEGDCYNREHSVPKSWFGDAYPMYTDIFHMYPTDGYVNNRRGNLAFGEVSSPTWTSSNGSKLGDNTYSGYTGTVFEPIDEYKGDLARSYFYMSVRYADKNLGQESNSMFEGSELKPWALAMLKEWHEADPVSEKEINRNNLIYNNIQHNRNPFIDCPELVNKIFGLDSVTPWYPTCVDFDTSALSDFVLGAVKCLVFPNPAKDQLTILSQNFKINCIEIFDISGKLLFKRDNIESFSEKIALTDFPNGCYFVRIEKKEKKEIHKLMVF